jgi:hypothetical protein
MTQRARAATGLTIFCFAWGQDSEIQIKLFNEFERRKELDGGAVGRGVLFEHERRLSANQGGGGDVIVIFDVARLGAFRNGHTT